MSHVTVYPLRVAPITEEVAGEQASMTIDDLAQRTGMTVRNIRAHQSRGLLPPPEVRGRTGYYGGEHLARIELIRELQADGFNLESIRRLLQGAGGSSREVLDFTRAIRAPFEEEEPEIVTTEELAGGWGPDADPALVRRAEGLGLIRPLGDGRFEAFSPRLQRAGVELARLGVPPERALDVVEKVRRHAQGVARTFTEVFLRDVWTPFDEAGRPEERWPEVRDALERLRPLASEALLAIFQLAMTEATEDAFEKVMRSDARGPSTTRTRSRGSRGRSRRARSR
jgi:DNA-binding transcriptional MerR regulator